MKFLLRGGRVIDPASGGDSVRDLLIEDGKIASGGPDGAEIIDCHGLVVSPGFVDLHVHFREPGQEYKEDVTARAALVQAGIPADRVIYEAESRNTWENAVFSKEMVRPQPGERWVLVTSAMHMPRSVGIFRQVGWEVIPYPVDYRTKHDATPWLRFEFGQNLVILDDAVREWIGLTAYRLMGRTESLFPAP